MTSAPSTVALPPCFTCTLPPTRVFVYGDVATRLRPGCCHPRSASMACSVALTPTVMLPSTMAPLSVRLVSAGTSKFSNRPPLMTPLQPLSTGD
ncbi:MAG: hypothetical protein R2856_32475 [Caldilineaceae bacterium]